MLVGGGELHDRWSRWCGRRCRCRAGSSASPGSPRRWSTARRRRRRCCPSWRGCSRAGCSWPTTPASTAACCARPSSGPGSTGPSRPCCARSRSPRKLAPLVRRRGPGARSRSALGIEVEEVHRALPDAQTCARVFCALFPRLCAHAATVGDALDLLPLAPAAPRKTEPAERIPPSRAPRPLRRFPDDPGVYVFRDERGRPLYVGKSVSLRSRARAHFSAPAGWTERAEIVDYRPTNSELGALVLENRLIKEWQPAGNRKLKRTDRHVLPALPPRHALPGARGVGRAGRRPRRERRAARQQDARHRAGRPAHLALPAAPLRAQAAPARAPVRLRADGPLRLTLPGRPRPQRLPAPARPRARASSTGPEPGGRAAGARSMPASREASAEQRYERAAALLRRRGRLAWVLERLEGILRATHAAPRLMLARHPVKERFDAFWIVRGRLVDWGPLPGHTELLERTGAALARLGGRSARPCRRPRSTSCGSCGAGSRTTSRPSCRSTRRRSPATCAASWPPRPTGPVAGVEAVALVGRVAERLGLGPAAAAEDDRLAVVRKLELVPVRVDQADRPGDLVGPVVLTLISTGSMPRSVRG